MIEAPTFEPLDEDATKHALLLMKSMFCARPVMVDGRQCFLQQISAGLSGGHVDMDVWITGNPSPLKAEKIIVPVLKID